MSKWHLRRLGEVAEIISGATPKTNILRYWDGNILWATPRDLGRLESIEINDTERRITKAGYESCSTRLLPVGSVLLSSRAPIGHLAINGKPMCTNQGFKSLVPGDALYNRYLYWFMKGSISELQSLGRGCTFDEISKGLVESFKIPVPPIDEQHRIVARIEDLTFRAEEARRARQKARTQISTLFFLRRQAVYQSFLSDFPSKPLGKCGKVVGGGTPSKSRGDYWHGDIPWIAPKEMKSFRIAGSSEQITGTAVSESSATLIPAPAVLFVVRGMILARYIPVGVSDVPCTINQDMKAIVPNEDILADYLAHMILGANDILLNMVETAGHGTKKLETAAWSSLDIPVPSIQTQKVVIEELTNFQEKLAELESLQRETEKALAIFQSALLSKAFRGEL
ncbi:MAG: hypothetical protein GX635_13090 [Synergistaceae bacterium]|jgi:type I restriction enzyme S subunit|nr:hypothetical protein [Synergistaceae bacterium]